MSGYDAPPNAKTQRGEILALLVNARGEWVGLPEIMKCAAQYNARVFELRRLGFKIENRSETDPTGTRHSWFRLVSTPDKARPEQATVAQLRTENTSGDWFTQVTGKPRPSGIQQNRESDLPLFRNGGEVF